MPTIKRQNFSPERSFPTNSSKSARCCPPEDRWWQAIFSPGLSEISLCIFDRQTVISLKQVAHRGLRAGTGLCDITEADVLHNMKLHKSMQRMVSKAHLKLNFAIHPSLDKRNRFSAIFRTIPSACVELRPICSKKTFTFGHGYGKVILYRGKWRGHHETFLGIDLTNNKNNEAFNGDAFLIAKPSPAMAQALASSSKEAEETVESSKLPLAIRIGHWICGAVGAVVALGILKALAGEDSVSLKEA